MNADNPQALRSLHLPVYAAAAPGGVRLTNTPPADALAYAPAVTPGSLGDPAFRAAYGLKYAACAGAMANGISSVDLLAALGRAGLMGSFGAGGLLPDEIEQAIHAVQQALPGGPYAFNLLNSPGAPLLEQRTVELYLQHGVTTVEASAYLAPSENLVWYRAAGLAETPDGRPQAHNRVIAKVSRREVARKFLAPPSDAVLNKLAAAGRISPRQAELARLLPLADDITVEADSGGHTDNRPLVCMLPAFLAQRDEFQQKYNYPTPVRVGAAGGIGTPAAALAAFSLGAAYIVTGSVNQACREAGTSPAVRTLLAAAEMTDTTMAPAADMFEQGVRVQVLKRGSLFAARAARLFELYSRFNSWEEIDPAERQKLEAEVFRRSFDQIWQDCQEFFNARDPRPVERALANPRDRLALVFRWYLGLSAGWAQAGVAGREMDYQIWCGPAMGAFNDWVRGTPLADPSHRGAAEINHQILAGAACLARLRLLELQGVRLPPELGRCQPADFPID